MARVTVGTENGNPIELHYEDHSEGQPIVLIGGGGDVASAREIVDTVLQAIPSVRPTTEHQHRRSTSP